jgi:PAS domain S-box-containing protein
MTAPRRSPWWYVAFAVIYFFCAHLGPRLANGLGTVQPTYWPALGVYLAFAAWTPPRGFPFLAAATLFAWTTSGTNQAVVSGSAVQFVLLWIGNTAAVFAGGALFRFGRERQGEAWSYRRIVAILVGSALGTPLISATVITLLVWARGDTEVTFGFWGRFFQADSLGILTVTPFILGILEEPPWATWRGSFHRLIAPAAALAILGAATFVIFSDGMVPHELHHSFLLYPGLCWIAIQGRRSLTGAANLITTIVLVYQTAHGHGIFSLAQGGTVSGLQLFIAINALVTLLLTEVVAERTRVTAALEAENQARRNAEERLELAVEATGLGVFEHVSAEEAVLLPRVLEILGLSQSEPVSLAEVNARIHEDDLPRITERLQQIADGLLVSWDDEVRVQPPGGPERWVSFHAKASAAPPSGGRRRIAGTLKDITAEAQAREELRRANAAAFAANQAKSRFLANMSHEIRTPLGAIVGFADLLLDDRSTPAERQEFAQVIRRNGLHLNELIDRILDLSKVEAGRLETVRRPVHVREVISDVLASLQLKAREKGLELSADVAPEVPAVIRTDAMRLRQILLNAVGNALKFTERGSVRIRVGMVPDGGDGDRLICDIIDTGIGLTREEQTRLFQPFSQANAEVARRFGGTGLGLTLSRHLAAMLGGSFELLRSEVGRGSTFRLTLTGEAAGGEAARQGAVAAAGAHMPAGPLAGMSVLLADDVAAGRRLVRRYLERAGATVDTADNGREAIERASAKTYDAILMDLQMPEVDGYEATATLRARAYHGPIVALTAHTQRDQVASVLVSGFSGHLGKPVDREAMIEQLRQLLEMRIRTQV